MAEKKNIQNAAFQNMAELLAFLPENQLVVVQFLRELIFDTIPNIKERLSSDIPFYSVHKGVCYIMPGAIPWGETWDGVEFGFNYGYLLLDENNYLDKGNRKQVFTKRFFSVDEINEEILRAYLSEAVDNDEIMFREKQMRRKK